MKPVRGAKRRELSPRRVATAPRARLEVDERRAQLLAVGMEVFSTRSYDDVSIDELARAAGISKGLLYHYFPTKRDFYVATVREGASQLLDLTVAVDATTPLERLNAGMDAYLDYVDRHGTAYVALMRGGVGSDPEVARIVDRTRETFCARLVEGVPIDAPSPLVKAALRGWVGFVEAMSLDWVERRTIGRQELRDVVIGVLLHTIQLATGAPLVPVLHASPSTPTRHET
jgi:AcrR family transcriptional regulator